MKTFLILAVLQLPALPETHFAAHPISHVVHIFDGDTICADIVEELHYRGGRRYWKIFTQDIRIEGYDSPEIGQQGADEAVEALREILHSGQVWVRWNGKWTFHRKRYEIRVVAPDGRVIDVADEMIRRGHHLPRSER